MVKQVPGDACVTTPVAVIMVATGVLLLDHMPPVAVAGQGAGCTHAHKSLVLPMAEGAVFTFIVVAQRCSLQEWWW